MDPTQQLNALAAAAGLAVVEDGAAPIVPICENVNEMARKLGQIVSRLDMFEMNGELVFFDHRGDRQVMTARTFRTWIADHVVIAKKYDKATGHVADVTSIPILDCATILESQNFRRGVRRIVGVNRERLPVIRPSGALELLPWGHDEQEHVYTTPGGLVYDEEMDVAAGKEWLEKHFRTFPFEGPRSLAVQIAAMLTQYVRHLPGGDGLRPGFMWLGNEPGCGKSVLAKAALYAVLGTAAAAKMKRNEELDKELEAFSRAAVPYIFLDNMYGNLASATLDQLLTSEESMGRSMGSHGVFQARNTAMVLITVNGADLNEDAKRRFVINDLHEKKDSEAREIPFPLTDKVMKSVAWRSRTLAALWSIVRNWYEVRMVYPGKPMRSFEEFTTLMGSIVMSAGYGDPFERVEIKDGTGPQKQDFDELMAAIVEEMGTLAEQTFTLEDIARLARSRELWIEKIGGIEAGKKLTIKEDGLGKEERGLAEDRGYMTPNQRGALTFILKPKAEKLFTVNGRTYEFGKREAGRKAKFPVRLLEE
jgi:hypothetical protein